MAMAVSTAVNAIRASTPFYNSLLAQQRHQCCVHGLILSAAAEYSCTKHLNRFYPPVHSGNPSLPKLMLCICIVSYIDSMICVASLTYRSQVADRVQLDSLVDTKQTKMADTGYIIERWQILAIIETIYSRYLLGFCYQTTFTVP